MYKDRQTKTDRQITHLGEVDDGGCLSTLYAYAYDAGVGDTDAFLSAMLWYCGDTAGEGDAFLSAMLWYCEDTTGEGDAFLSAMLWYCGDTTGEGDAFLSL
jgi:hypothetical protein